jgi:hypothetical protein
MRREDAFAFFGVASLRNPRWSWSGRNEELNRVVVTAWKHYFHWTVGKPAYRFPAPNERRGVTLEETLRTQHGLKPLIADIEYALAYCGGILHVVLCEVQDADAHTYEIKACHGPNPWLVLKVTSFNRENGAFEADVITLPTPVAPVDNDIPLGQLSDGTEVIFHPHGSGPFAH